MRKNVCEKCPDALALELRLESSTLLRSILAEDDGLILAFQQHIAHTRVMAYRHSRRPHVVPQIPHCVRISGRACLCMSCLTVCEEHGNSRRVKLLIHRAGVMRAVVEIARGPVLLRTCSRPPEGDCEPEAFHALSTAQGHLYQ